MTSSAAITLHLAAGNTIVALPSGERHRWATTALELAGFTRHQGEAHRLPLGDHAHARATLSQLHETARDCQAKVITSERPYLGDIAVVVAEILPGSWEVEVEHYPDGSIPAHLLEWAWERPRKENFPTRPSPPRRRPSLRRRSLLPEGPSGLCCRRPSRPVPFP
ncbi:hypothetical protein ACN6LM_002615 [Streptomyces sp. SAS_281]|uniref:hypothetical protein n=1 Tax=Streptomyces sp. SAS_281 TaxID=3412744 RepID=UPI00403C3D69